VACLDAAARHAPAGLDREVAALAELVGRGSSPGDDLLRTARHVGAAGALLAATRDPEEQPCPT
jgi:glutamate--cysteine ligase